jgi:signal transduction histidine kinase/streptogramin lyase
LVFQALFISDVSYSQSGQPAALANKLFFDHFGLEAGFRSREAMDIVTTPNGMVWVSSNDGLARFDSKRFKFYKHIDGDTFSLANNYCQALATDKRGLIWVQSDDHLDVFNPTTERFSHITLSDGKGGKLLVYPRKFVYDSVSDIMWIGTSKGLYFSKNGSLDLQSAGQLSGEKLLTSSPIGAMATDGADYLWVTISHQVIKLNTRNGKTQKFSLPAKVDGYLNDPNNTHFLSAYLDSNKILWLGTWVNGLISFDTQNNIFHQYCFRDNTKEENTILDIAQTNEPGKEQVLWLTTSGYGLATFNMETKRFYTYHTPVSNDPFGIKGTTYGLHPDGKKGMWVGSESGLHLYDYNKQIFKTIDLNSIAKGAALLPVSNMAVQKNVNNRDEILWFYIPYHGGYLYDLVRQTIRPLPSKIAGYINLPNEFLGFYIDAKNILWISTVNFGLTGYDIHKDAIVFRETKPFSEKKNWVCSFFEDRRQRLWVGSYNGLYVMDSTRKIIKPVSTVNEELQKSGHSLIITDITEDEKVNIWFTADLTDKKNACIGKINPWSNHVEFVYDEKRELGINHNPVELGSIVCNGNGKIFTVFNGEGIAWFNSKKVDSIPYFLTSEQGLGSNRTNGFIADKNGNIWCSTSFGVSCYKVAQNIFSNYNYTAYAFDNTQGPSIYFSSQSGMVYVGQSNAIKVFNTGINSSGIEQKQLVFSEMKVLNKNVTPSGKLLSNDDIIQLSHKENMLSIEFALLSFTNAADNTYSWMLQGWDKDWITSKNNIASYINLEPGDYTFLVKAANSQGEWIDKPIKLIIKIAYPFYRTWWFIALCILILAGLVYWYIQQRIRQIQEKYQLRNKIAADLHDEIGSTLTSINILSNVSQQAMEQQPQQAKEMLQQISAQSKTIQQSMSDIVWSIRPDNDKVEDLVTRMREYAAQTLEQLDIDIKITTDDVFASKILPMEYRKELLLIYKEAINNISKHSGATRVSVLLETTNQHINLIITDNGKWKGDNSGTGTLSMQARAESIGGTFKILSGDSGTRVSACIPIT